MQCVVRRLKWNRVMRDGSRGALLIEVLIALAILGVISVVFIGAMYTSLHAARITDERSVGLTLAKSQVEFVNETILGQRLGLYCGCKAQPRPAWR